MRKLLSTVIVLAASLTAAIPAAAAGPTIVPVPGFGPVTVTPLCGAPIDPVTVQSTLQLEKSLVFGPVTSPTRIITTGHLVVSITSATGKTITQNVSGPGVMTPNSDGTWTLVTTGPESGWIGDLYGHGRLVLLLAADQVTVLKVISQVGNSQSICAMLAS